MSNNSATLLVFVWIATVVGAVILTEPKIYIASVAATIVVAFYEGVRELN